MTSVTPPVPNPNPGSPGDLRIMSNAVRELLKGNFTFYSTLKFIPVLITANTTLSSQAIVLCNTTSGAVTITLPPVSVSRGVVYFIKKADASGNSVTIDGNASEEIDGATTLVISSAWDKVRIVCDGTQWLTI